MIAFRPFTQTDWYAFAGATSFPDGNPPLIGELKVNGEDATAVVDAEGLSVFWGDEGQFTATTTDANPLVALRTALLLPAETSSLGLKALGINTEYGDEDVDHEFANSFFEGT